MQIGQSNIMIILLFAHETSGILFDNGDVVIVVPEATSNLRLLIDTFKSPEAELSERQYAVASNFVLRDFVAYDCSEGCKLAYFVAKMLE